MRKTLRKTKKSIFLLLKKNGFIRDKRRKQPIYEKLLFRFAPAVFVVAMGIVFLHISPTNTYYNDTEVSPGNAFFASSLDFQLTNNSLEKFIGPEALGEISHTSVVMPESGSLPMQYIVSNNILNGDSGLCSKLTVEAKLNGVSKYSGPFSGFAFSTTTEFGTWEFRFDMPPLTVASNGDKCKVETVFHAWRADVDDPLKSGYTDEEKINFSFTARMVVLNEIFARPNGGSAPKDKEYIELYNNGNTPVDVANWSISEISGTTENKHTIVASGATASQMEPYNGASTVIPPGGFLVLRFGGSASYLNDSGDTVRLYDSDSSLLDSHKYPSLSAGKSVVRFPDGIGFWVDPDPTPGEKNMVSMADLKSAGFDDETISQIVALAGLKNENLQQTDVTGSSQVTVPDSPTVPADLQQLDTNASSTATIVTESAPAEVLPEPAVKEPVVDEPAPEIPQIIQENPVVKEPETTVETKVEPAGEAPPEPAVAPEVTAEPAPVAEVPVSDLPSNQ